MEIREGVSIKRHSRRAALATAGAMTGAILAACGGPGAGGSGQGATGTGIKVEAGNLIWYLWDAGPERLPYYEEIAKTFQAQNPSIKLELVPPLPGGGGRTLTS